MNNNNYVETIDEAKELLTELLNDPDHGELTFKGLRLLDDLTITGPRDLEDLLPGTVLAVNYGEWMATSAIVTAGRHWQNFESGKVATSEELYVHALKESDALVYCHKGL